MYDSSKILYSGIYLHKYAKNQGRHCLRDAKISKGRGRGKMKPMGSQEKPGKGER
jgi:hypothetical protein